MCPNPTWSSSLSVGKLSCQMKTTTQTTISATVTTGNRAVGMLSFSGITGVAKPSCGPERTEQLSRALVGAAGSRPAPPAASLTAAAAGSGVRPCETRDRAALGPGDRQRRSSGSAALQVGTSRFPVWGRPLARLEGVDGRLGRGLVVAGDRRPCSRRRRAAAGPRRRSRPSSPGAGTDSWGRAAALRARPECRPPSTAAFRPTARTTSSRPRTRATSPAPGSA